MRVGRTRRTPGWCRHAVWLLATMTAVAVAPRTAQAADWHCRIGVCGTYCSGYVGLLGRHGIPCEYILDGDLDNLSVLKQYDVVIFATVYPTTLAPALPALEDYVAGGGHVLVDSAFMWRVPETSQSADKSFLYQFLRRSLPVRRQSAELTTVANCSLATVVPPTTTFGPLFVGLAVKTNAPGAEVWAHYTSLREDRSRRAPAWLQMLHEGDPAIVNVPRGSGSYILCGPALSIGMALQGVNADSLILGMLNLITHGAATPQLIDEGVRLGRRESLLSLNKASEREASFDVSPPPTVERNAASGSRSSLPSGFDELSQDADPEFVIRGVLPSRRTTGTIVFNYWNADSYWALRFQDGEARLYLTEHGKERRMARRPLPEMSNIRFQLRERAAAVELYLSGGVTVRVETEALWQGSAGVSKELDDVHYQATAPVYFADDFMRGKDEEGDWTVDTGKWELSAYDNPDMGANSFNWRVNAQPVALASTGYWFWDTYRMRASVRPQQVGGAVGVVAYMVDENNYVLFQAKVVKARPGVADGFSIIVVRDGKPTVLGTARGGLVAGEWYQLGIKLIDKWIGAFVDGQKVITVADTSFPSGKAGLWADHTNATFDDVKIEPSDQRAGRGRVFAADMPNYAGVVDQDTWAGPAIQWTADPEHQRLFWKKGFFYGDVGLRFEGDGLTHPGYSEDLLLNAEIDAPDSGYRLTATNQNGSLHIELFRAGQRVAAADYAPPSGSDPPVLAMRRDGGKILGRIGSRTVLVYDDPNPLSAHHRIGFRFSDGLARISNIAYWTENVYDYTFEAAPTDWWIASGDWDVTNRWSCTPDWSWFGGTSPKNQKGDYYTGVAAIWQKHYFAGDVVMDFFTGPKMLPVAGTKRSREEMRDFHATLCGDGVDVNSGYTFEVAPDGAGEIRILKQNQVVARSKNFIMPERGHNRWLALRVARIGNAVEAYFDGQLVVRYDDPDPLPGGYAAIWTNDNGILLPRVTIYYQATQDPLLSLLPDAPRTTS